MAKFVMTDWLQQTAAGPASSGGLVHLRQGDMDGACGPYCLYMALIAMGFIDRNDATDQADHKGSTRLGKLRDAMQLFGPLVSDGTSIMDLTGLAHHFYYKGLKYESICSGNKKAIFDAAVNAIDQGGLAILCVKWPGGDGHWVLVVGYECSEDMGEGELPTRLLCLDPGIRAPVIYGWNVILNVFNEDGKAIHKGPLPVEHWDATGQVTKCQITGGIVLSLKG